MPTVCAVRKAVQDGVEGGLDSDQVKTALARVEFSKGVVKGGRPLGGLSLINLDGPQLKKPYAEARCFILDSYVLAYHLRRSIMLVPVFSVARTPFAPEFLARQPCVVLLLESGKYDGRTQVRR